MMSCHCYAVLFALPTCYQCQLNVGLGQTTKYLTKVTFIFFWLLYYLLSLVFKSIEVIVTSQNNDSVKTFKTESIKLPILKRIVKN
jgi:hypothetical protein